jgi:putative transferase (TIGR04331 family)
LAGKKKIKHAADGGLLLIELSLPRYSYHLYSAPISGQWLNYLEDQLTFVNSLPNNIRDDLTIRLFPDDYGWKTEELWREKFPNVDINSEHGGLERLFKKTRLQVCTYNATTYLESLKLNMPTIIFWDPMYWEIREDSTPYFEKLAEVGIFHKSPESAALHVAKIWGAVECWWDSYEVQNARNQFCREYSYEPLNPISDLNKIVQVV